MIAMECLKVTILKIYYYFHYQQSIQVMWMHLRDALEAAFKILLSSLVVVIIHYILMLGLLPSVVSKFRQAVRHWIGKKNN